MTVLNRLAKRYRTTDGRRYVCTLCGATFEDVAVVICPKCRGLVTERTT